MKQDILNKDQIEKITVKNIKTGEELAVITNALITTASDDIIVVLTPGND